MTTRKPAVPPPACGEFARLLIRRVVENRASAMRSPGDIRAGLGPRREFADNRQFTAGFASGEQAGLPAGQAIEVKVAP